MTKKDKLIIEFEYLKSDVHFTDEQMEQMVNNWTHKIITELKDVRSELHFNAMALASIYAKNIVRQANVSGTFCTKCGKMKQDAYSEEKVERCNCKNLH